MTQCGRSRRQVHKYRSISNFVATVIPASEIPQRRILYLVLHFIIAIRAIAVVFVRRTKLIGYVLSLVLIGQLFVPYDDDCDAFVFCLYLKVPHYLGY